MKDKTMTVWSVPLECVEYILNTLRRQCSDAVLKGEYEKADSILYCIRGIDKDYQHELAEINRLNEE